MASRKEFDKKNGEEKAKREVDAAVTVVLKLDLHCEGCAVKLSRSIKGLEGAPPKLLFPVPEIIYFRPFFLRIPPLLNRRTEPQEKT